MHMRRTVVLLVVAMFLLSSVPFVFAERGSGQSRGRDRSVGVEHELEDEGVDDQSQERLRIHDLRVDREALKKAKGEFKALKEKLKEERKNAQELRKNLRACADLSTDACEAAKGKFDVHIENVVNLVLTKLEELKRLVQSVDLDKGKMPDVVARADELIAKIKSKLDAAKNAGTKEAYRAALKELKNVLREAQDFVHTVMPQTFNNRLGGILEKAKQLGAKLDRLLERAKSDGRDVSGVEPLITSFKSTVDEALKKFADAKSSFAAGNHEAARKAMQEAHQLLKKAHELLRQIHQTLKNKDVDVSTLASDAATP